MGDGWGLWGFVVGVCEGLKGMGEGFWGFVLGFVRIMGGGFCIRGSCLIRFRIWGLRSC